MKKTLLFIAILTLTHFTSGQIKKVAVSSDEISVLGRITSGSLKKNFTQEELKTFEVRNTLAYLLEYTYNDKVIYSDVLSLTNNVFGDEVSVRTYINSFPCFKLSTIPQKIAFSLMKTNKWSICKGEDEEYICCKPYGMFNKGLDIFTSKDYKKYSLIDLANGQIKLRLYRLVK